MSSVTLAPFQVLRSHVAHGFPSGQRRLQTTSIITDHSGGQHWVQALLDLCPRVPRSSEEKVQFLRLAALRRQLFAGLKVRGGTLHSSRCFTGVAGLMLGLRVSHRAPARTWEFRHTRLLFMFVWPKSEFFLGPMGNSAFAFERVKPSR